MLRKATYITYLFLTIIIQANAQEWKDELLALNQTYLNAKSFSMDVIAETYNNSKDTKPVLTYKGKAAKQNNDYYSYITGKTTISNKHCLVVIDERQKIILYAGRDKQELKTPGLFSLAGLDSALLLMSKELNITCTNKGGNEKRITISNKNTPSEKQELFINTQTHTLTRIDYYTEQQVENKKVLSRISVKYNNVKLNDKIPEDLFSEKKFVSRKIGGTLATTKNYNNYKLIDESQTIIP